LRRSLFCLFVASRAAYSFFEIHDVNKKDMVSRGNRIFFMTF